MNGPFAIIAALLLMGACANADAGPGDDPPEPAILELRAHTQGPSATLTVGDQSQEGVQGSSCWSIPSEGGGSSSGCGDVGGYEVPETAVGLVRGSTIRLEADSNEQEVVIGRVIHGENGPEFKSVQKLDFSDGEDTIDVPPGDYAIDVFAVWDQGDSAFHLRIRVA